MTGGGGRGGNWGGGGRGGDWGRGGNWGGFPGGGFLEGVGEGIGNSIGQGIGDLFNPFDWRKNVEGEEGVPSVDAPEVAAEVKPAEAVPAPVQA